MLAAGRLSTFGAIAPSPMGGGNNSLRAEVAAMVVVLAVAMAP